MNEVQIAYTITNNHGDYPHIKWGATRLLHCARLYGSAKQALRHANRSYFPEPRVVRILADIEEMKAV